MDFEYRALALDSQVGEFVGFDHARDERAQAASLGLGIAGRLGCHYKDRVWQALGRCLVDVWVCWCEKSIVCIPKIDA